MYGCAALEPDANQRDVAVRAWRLANPGATSANSAGTTAATATNALRRPVVGLMVLRPPKRLGMTLTSRVLSAVNSTMSISFSSKLTSKSINSTISVALTKR